MKICHLIYDDVGNPWLGGGGALRAREIYRRLAERHEITLITGCFPGGSSEEFKDGLRFLRVGSEHSYARSRLGYCRAAVACLQRQEWDVWVHEFSAFAPLWVPGRLRCRGILFFYHFVGHHALKKHPLVGGVSWAAEALTLRRYQRIVTISPSMQEQVRSRLRGRSVQIDCVYTGVGEHYFDLEPEEQPYLLYFGRTDVHTKGIDVLLRAFAYIAGDYPELQLKIAGRGSAREVALLHRLVRSTEVADRIEVLGEVDEAHKGELLRRALFVCTPSRYEGWCIVAVEASAAGKPVLGTRIDGLKDAVRDGETGILVEAGHVEQLAQGMRNLLGDRPRRISLGERGRIWARRFDWDQIARDQEEIYLRTARENGAL
jgi:glycogen(starch) synthase